MSPIGGNGKICGVSPGYEQHPYLFIGDIKKATEETSIDLFKYGVCVKACPHTATETIDCKITDRVRSCNLDKVNKYGTSYFFEYCMPVYETLDPVIQGRWETINNEFNKSKSGSVMMDVYDARWVITGGIFISIVLTMIYIKFMDKCASQLAWASVVLLVLFLLGSGAAAWYTRYTILKDDDPENDYDSTLFYIAIAMWAIAGIFIMMILCFWNSLKVSIAIIETAADYFADSKRILLVPIVFFVSAVLVFAIWMAGVICVHSIGDITVEGVRT